MVKAFAVLALFSMMMLGVACSEDDAGGSSEREEFIQSAEDRIAELRNELEQMREDIANSDAGGEIEQQANALESRIDDAESELEDVRAANDDEWEDLKGRVDDALGDAGNRIDEIGRDLGID